MNRLAYLRKSLKQDPNFRKLFTQAGFAKLLGCSASLIRYLEQNDAPPSRSLRLSIKEKLGIDPSWFSAPSNEADAAVIATALAKLNKSEGGKPEFKTKLSADSFRVEGMIAAVISATTVALREDLERGDHTLLNSLHELLGARGLSTLRDITVGTVSRAQLSQALARHPDTLQDGVEAD
jgi:transcriptional regulator with XRE-family HTH domain